MAEEEKGNIRLEYNNATVGLNMDQTLNQIKPGTLTYALNAALENFDASSVNYQNEQGNEFCVSFPQGFTLIGNHFIGEQNKHIFFITNPNTGDCEIGYMDNNDCIYHILVGGKCLNFNIKHPIQKTVHKITNCTTEIYWTDGLNPRRYLDINNIPYLINPAFDLCDPQYLDQLDCNQLKIQPNFSIPFLNVVDVISGGELKAGTVQFAIQYSDAAGNAFTSYYSVTNPTPIVDPFITTVNYNYTVGRSVVLDITNLDVTGQYQYYNLAVITTVNAITSVELVGTYFIENATDQVIYTGQNVDSIRLTIADIFEKYPYYDIAQDLTAVQDVLVWDNLSSIDRLNYQSIASQITLNWQTYRIPKDENYSDELNATNLRGYLRDEVYAFEIVFLLKNGKQTDGFHIPGRMMNNNEIGRPPVSDTDPDFIGEPDPGTNTSPYWKIYNTATVIGAGTGDNIGNATPYQYGEFAYWESTEEYPCNIDVWGDLAGQPIRHHKFPDVLVSPIFENPVYIYSGTQVVPVMQNDAVYPIGVRLDVGQVSTLIANSALTVEQKDDIVAFKIVRGDRGTNKSIIAKGILRNIGTYERQNQTFYYPNYPYNDLNEDPFLNSTNNAFSAISEPWLVIATTNGTYQFNDPNTNQTAVGTMVAGQTYEFCSTSRPTVLTGQATIGPGNFDSYFLSGCRGCKGWRATWATPFTSDNSALNPRMEFLDGNSNIFGGGCSTGQAVVNVGGGIGEDCTNGIFDPCRCNPRYDIEPEVVQPAPVPGLPYSVNFNISRRSSLSCKGETPIPAFTGGVLNYRQIFNSPETSFGQPFLGNVLKLENVMFGAGRAHFVQVKSNAKYKLLTEEAQRDALASSAALAASATFNASYMFAAYQAYLTIYVNGITRKNYAYSFNSIANYDYFGNINNGLGIKQRKIDFARYLIPGVQSVGEPGGINVNNYERESSVYIKTIADRNGVAVTPLEFPSKTPSLVVSGNSIITDKSRYTISSGQVCNSPGKEKDISVVSYYGSMKNIFVNQWGQIYSYVTIDTGFQKRVDPASLEVATVFGGDTFISRFTFKTKLPFFIDNRVNAPDDSDIFYDEIGNIAYPVYWHSARSILEDFTVNGVVMSNIISYKAHNFDCPNHPELTLPPDAGSNRTFYDGYFYLFSYGIPNFYCESSYNVDLRQAFNNREGDFWPHVSTGIPDDWVQEDYVSIANDNTYTYNVTFSKQNKENTFTHLPADWTSQFCYTYYPFRAIYSDSQIVDADNRVNNWLTYRALSYYDFPQNYGNLISLDGIQNRAILARFENKSLMYDNLLTINTTNPQAAYVGNPSLFKGSPPIDFAETDLGYVGSQNKFLLKIPNGQITVDAKRGQIFLISGTQAAEISGFGSGMNRFFTDHLAFEILRYFPKVNIDNNFTGVGLHGVYDSKFERVIITKLDYIPIDKDVKYDPILQEYYVEDIIETVVLRTQVYLTDPDYFCNKSWTISFNINTKSWVSFHTYIPNFYIAENNFFYSGINGCCDDATFEALVGSLVPIPSTTTTTTAVPPLTTTTTTTVIVLDCELEGIATTLDCELAGNAITTVPSPSTTTTTTICTRPAGLNLYGFFTGYQFESDPPVDSTGSLIDACAAITFTNLVSASMTGFSVNAANLLYGSTVYLGNGIDCTLVPDGWYFTDESRVDGFAYHVVSGIISQISSCTFTTTTTSTTLFPPLYFCYTVQVQNNCEISWIDYSDILQTQSVSFGIIYICAREASITSVCEPGGSVIVTLSGNPCTSDLDCQPTTTTTTTVP